VSKSVKDIAEGILWACGNEGSDYFQSDWISIKRKDAESDIAQAINQAVQTEREACAKVAEEFASVGGAVADEIRERGQE